MTPLLHRLDKRNKPILPTLLKLRALVADWAEGTEPRKDYKDYSRKQGTTCALKCLCIERGVSLYENIHRFCCTLLCGKRWGNVPRPHISPISARTNCFEHANCHIYSHAHKCTGATVHVTHPARVVSPAASQLYILRTHIYTLCDSDSELRKKASLFGKADLEKPELDLFQRFFEDSFYYPYVLNFAQTLTQVALILLLLLFRSVCTLRAGAHLCFV